MQTTAHRRRAARDGLPDVRLPADRRRTAAARRLLDALPAIASRFDPTRSAAPRRRPPAFFALAAIPARYALERGAWADAATLDAASRAASRTPTR